MNIAPDTLHALLDVWPVAHLASVTPTGSAHVIPIVFVRDQNSLVTPIDGKRKDGRPLQRLRNLAANPAVEILLHAYDQDWEKLWWVRLAGVARETPLAPTLAAMLRGKYPQYASLGEHALMGTAIRLSWTRATAWAQADSERVFREAIVEATTA